MEGHNDFEPARDMPDLSGKVILVTGGTAGLGEYSVKAFAAQNPAHIYFTGRNDKAAEALISQIRVKNRNASVSFIKIDLSSMSSVKEGITKGFKHDRLDILMNNAGIIAKPATLSADGYEIQFATNHLGHAMLTKHLLPILVRTAQQPGSDVRIISNTSDGYAFHKVITGGISFSELESGSTMSRLILGPWVRYGQSKLANILFATELARRYPNITSVTVHPGVVDTPMTTDMKGFNKYFVDLTSWMGRIPRLKPEQGVLNQLWCAAGAKKDDLRNGGFYRPVGVDSTDGLSAEAKDAALAEKLWNWTEDILAKY